MKRGGWIALAIVAVVVLFVANQLVGNYNRLVGADQGVKQRWAQVDNQLQRRNDLIGNLVESVKGTAFQEQQVFGDIANARAQMAGAKTPAERTAAAETMDQALGGSALARLLVVVENYPQLRSNEAFMQLMDELAGTENRLATERMRYNDEVRGYNVLVKRFPTNLYASIFRFGESPYYEIPEASREAPKVDMGSLRDTTRR
jgi:LemA protein